MKSKDIKNQSNLLDKITVKEGKHIIKVSLNEKLHRRSSNNFYYVSSADDEMIN